MSRPSHDLSEIIALYGTDFEQKHAPTDQQRSVLAKLSECRTSPLGGHVDACDACGTIRISYNSCRNRHCPKCQATSRERWIEAREDDLLDVSYFHVVFTLPEELNALFLLRSKTMYNILFEAVKLTLEMFAANPNYRAPHLGSEYWLSSAPALHCSGWWRHAARKMEIVGKSRQSEVRHLSVSCKSLEQRVQQNLYATAQSQC